MYAINGISSFGNLINQGDASITTTGGANLTVSDSYIGLSGTSILLQDFSGIGTRPLAVDTNGFITEGASGGTNFDITDDFVTDTHISDAYTFRIGGRAGNNVVKTIWASPTELEIRLEGGAPGQVVGYDSDFGAGWVSGMLTYSDTITPIAGSPLVITHNWGTTSVQVSVYDTATGEQVIPAVVSRDSNAVRITMSTSDEIEIVIIGFN